MRRNGCGKIYLLVSREVGILTKYSYFCINSKSFYFFSFFLFLKLTEIHRNVMIYMILIKVTSMHRFFKNLNILFPFCSSKSCDNSHVTREKAKTSYSTPVFIPAGPRIPIFGIPVTVSTTPSTWPMVLRTPRAHPCGWCFKPFPRFYTKSTKSPWLCALFITSLSLNDIIRRHFIGAFLYGNRNHWSSFRFISRLDFMGHAWESCMTFFLLWIISRQILPYLYVIFLTSFFR